MDFITVVYRGELDMLPVQAKSMELYAHNIPENIWVVVNDDESVAYEIDRAWWGTMQDRVHVRTRKQLGVPDYGTGWDSQQLCKLVMASKSTASHAIIFDAKTWFVKQLKESDFVNPDTQMIPVPINDIQPVFKDGWDYIVQMLGIDDPNTQVGPAGVPYIMITDLVRSLFKWIEETQNYTSFIDWFVKYNLYPTLVTEFLLYSAWEYKTTKYELRTGKQIWRCINIARDEYGIFDEKMQSMRRPNALTASIHRDVFKNLTEAQTQEWHDYLASKGLG